MTHYYDGTTVRDRSGKVAEKAIVKRTMADYVD